MTDPKLFQLTDEDKAHYNKLIENIDLKSKNELLRVIGPKIMSMMDEGNLNAVEVNLLNEISDLLGIMELYPDLQPQSMKRILFAISYFCDVNDDIPDIVPEIGYLDDAVVARWVIESISKDLPEVSLA